MQYMIIDWGVMFMSKLLTGGFMIIKLKYTLL